jgi:hypothetical protein
MKSLCDFMQRPAPRDFQNKRPLLPDTYETFIERQNLLGLRVFV